MLQYEVEEIRVPKESMNDDTVLLVKWHVQRGAKVKSGQLVVTVETSKAAFDIEAPDDGYVFYESEEGAQVAVGAVLAVVSHEKSFAFDSYEPNGKGSVTGGAGSSASTGTKAVTSTNPAASADNHARFSKTALKIIEENKLDKSIFADKSMVTKDDVLKAMDELRRVRSTDARLDQAVEDKNNGGRKPKRSKTEKKDSTSTLKKVSSEQSSGIKVGTSAGQKLVIFGGGGHAKICIDMIKQMMTYEIIGIIDEHLHRGKDILGVPVLGGDRELEGLYNDGIRLAVNGVGSITNPPVRGEVFRQLKQIGFQLPNIIHPRAAIEPSVLMGEGNQIMANAVVGAAVRIHNNCIINAGAIVSHDTVLHDNAHVAPGAILAADISVGRNTLIGMGSTIYLGVTIGDNAVVFNGCNVTKDVESDRVVKA